MSTPTLINLPPPPSDPVTPSEIPGTPNSGTTSMSELSTVAIKDGHRGHPHHHHAHSRLQTATSDINTDNADAERADRISRLPGLERAHTVRQNSNASLPPGASATTPHGYFDAPPPPASAYLKERSTVGSASATGSIGGRTTWASGSDMYDAATDKMSEDQDQDMDTNMDTSSVGGFSEGGDGSLVGFGEGAGSTVSGPISSMGGPRTPQRQSGAFGSRNNNVLPYIRDTPTTPRDVRMVDGPAYDAGAGEPFHGHYQGHAPRQSMTGTEQAEQIMSGSFNNTTPGGMHLTGERNLGSFPFEQGK